MKITLVFYAVLQEVISEEPLILEINSGSTAGDVIKILSEKYPRVADILKVTRLANEDEYVDKKSVLNDGKEYCLIPPVSGG